MCGGIGVSNARDPPKRHTRRLTKAPAGIRHDYTILTCIPFSLGAWPWGEIRPVRQVSESSPLFSGIFRGPDTLPT